MKKNQLIALIQSWLEGGNTNTDLKARYHPELVSYNIGRAFNQIIYETFRKDLSNLDLYRKRYDNVAVDEDGKCGLYYSDLPAPIVQLPEVGQGVRIFLAHSKRESIDFVPVREDAIDVYANLDVGLINPFIGYFITGTRVYYTDMKQEITSVMMRLVIPFEAYDDDDDVYIPSGKDLQIYQLVCQFMLGEPPPDKITDANAKQV